MVWGARPSRFANSLAVSSLFTEAPELLMELHIDTDAWGTPQLVRHHQQNIKKRFFEFLYFLAATNGTSHAFCRLMLSLIILDSVLPGC